MKRAFIAHVTLMTILMASVAARGAVGKLSGPYTHRNLELFLVHGTTDLEQRKYLTLSEAMAKGEVVVKETGSVQELRIENVSKNASIFLNAGDIVKGGRQDRTVQEDLVLPPGSGLLPLHAFCVEHGRWTGRGQESPGQFSMNNKVLSSRKLKMAARYGSNQGEVWSGVDEQQMQLNKSISELSGKQVDTRNSASASSYQLTLENKDLDSVKKEYLDRLNSIISEQNDVIGFVYAINGDINSAEVYNNKALFRALWPKLLDAAITEAIAEYRSHQPVVTVEAADVRSFFETAVTGRMTEKALYKTTRVRTYTTPATVLFETLDESADGTWLHKSFLHKEKQTVVVPLDGESRQQYRR